MLQQAIPVDLVLVGLVCARAGRQTSFFRFPRHIGTGNETEPAEQPAALSAVHRKPMPAEKNRDSTTRWAYMNGDPRAGTHRPDTSENIRNGDLSSSGGSPSLKALPAKDRASLRGAEWHSRLLAATRACGLRFHLGIAVVLPSYRRCTEDRDPLALACLAALWLVLELLVVEE